MESFPCYSCVLELITENISGLIAVFQMFCFQPALRPYSCLFLIAGFLLLLQGSFLTVQFCTWILYSPTSVVHTCLRFRVSFQNLIFVLYRSDGLSCRDCEWRVGCGFFKLLRGRRNQSCVVRPRNSAFQHTCVQIESFWKRRNEKHDEELGSFWVIKSICVTVWRIWFDFLKVGLSAIAEKNVKYLGTLSR